MLMGGQPASSVSRFFPQPAEEILIPVESAEGISEEEFKTIIKNFVSVYAPVVKQEGYTLVLKNKWADPTVNSDTTVSGKTWVINAYGGLARFKGMNADAYMLVMCHEIGHHLGGFPTYPSPNNWASNEGQSDYFATLKCFRRLADAGMLLADPQMEVPATAKKKCSKSQNPAFCERSAMAGFVLATVLNDLQENPVPVSFDKPDPKVVVSTSNGHPKAQCRLDTMLAGAVCNQDWREDISRSNGVKGTCSEGDGARPLCWYAPKSSLWPWSF